MGNAAIAGLREVFQRRKIKAIVQGFGPMFQIYFTERDAIHDYRDYCTYVDTQRYSRFVHRLLEQGIYMTPSNGLHWIISTAHTERDVAALIEAADQADALRPRMTLKLSLDLKAKPRCFWVEVALPARCWRGCGWRNTIDP